MASFSLFGWIRTQLTPLPPVKPVDLSGRTVVVTGANVGLGFEAAKHFARMRPAKLVIACRSKEKGEAALAELTHETGYTGAEVLLLDMASFASVSAFVSAFEASHERLDVLVLNAGVAMFDYQTSQDGWELMLQVNHLSTMLLSLLLLPRMLQTADVYGTHPHMAVVCSETHFTTDFDKLKKLLAAPSFLEEMSSREYCTRMVIYGRYNDTKLFNIMLARSLNARLPPASPLVITSTTPGLCRSSFRRAVPFPLTLLVSVMELMLQRTTEMGSRTLVAAALTGENGDTALRDSARGAYMDSCKLALPSKWLYTEDGKEVEKRLWEETVQVLAKADPRVQEVVEKYLTSNA